jgi:hypothetical protein
MLVRLVQPDWASLRLGPKSGTRFSDNPMRNQIVLGSVAANPA